MSTCRVEPPWSLGSRPPLRFILRVSCCRLLGVLLIIWHWISCIWWSILTIDEAAGMNRPPIIAERVARGMPPYMIALHFAISVSTNLGSTTDALSSGQVVFEVGVSCFGLVLQSLIFGTVASIVAMMEEGKRVKQAKFSLVRQYLHAKRVPPYVRQRVLSYYQYIYARVRPEEETQLLGELPSTLRIELAIVNNRPFLGKVDIFRKAEAGAVAFLSLLMQTITVVPHTNVLVQGEDNHTLYCVRSGELKVFILGDTHVGARDWNEVAEEEAPDLQRRSSGWRFEDTVESLRLKDIGHVESDISGYVRNVARSIGAGIGTGFSSVRNAGSGVVGTKRWNKKISSRSNFKRFLTRRDTDRAGSKTVAAENVELDDSGSPQEHQRKSSFQQISANSQSCHAVKSVINANQERIQKIRELGGGEDSYLGAQVGRLTDGMTFGEQSFLSEVSLPSMATVRTVAYCQLVTLAHKELATVINMYPSLSDALHDYAEEKKSMYETKNAETMEQQEKGTSSFGRIKNSLEGIVHSVGRVSQRVSQRVSHRESHTESHRESHREEDWDCAAESQASAQLEGGLTAAFTA